MSYYTIVNLFVIDSSTIAITDIFADQLSFIHIDYHVPLFELSSFKNFSFDVAIDAIVEHLVHHSVGEVPNLRCL